jgi:hypothetical protein
MKGNISLSFGFNNAAHRHVGETNMNVHSSRSHTIFRMVRNDAFAVDTYIVAGG